MKNRLLSLADKLLLRRRAIIESVISCPAKQLSILNPFSCSSFPSAFSPPKYKYSTGHNMIDQLKNISQIEHSRHRSPVNCLVNLVCGLIARMPPAKETIPYIRCLFA